jgi:wyosine [tRNA(Phe)-imidazoG37] synthetase (radical SAM superfamily)
MTEPPGLVFGPVPSRRLGRSLGINNLPAKTCTYSCVYCQVGRTTCLRARRGAFHDPALLERVVARRLARAGERGERIDTLTFVPSGEPTLDAGLGRAIRHMKRFGPRVAVITNASLLWRADVREDLADADWVSVKVDSANERTWRVLNRAHGALDFARVLRGTQTFAAGYGGILATETMLVAGVNDGEEDVRAVARYVGALRPSCAYIAAPLRPPAEPWVRVPDDQALVTAYAAMRRHVPRVRFLTRDEDNVWQAGDEVVAALLAIAAIHPMRAESVDRLLASGRAERGLVDRLVREGRLECVRHRNRDFYRVLHA